MTGRDSYEIGKDALAAFARQYNKGRRKPERPSRRYPGCFLHPDERLDYIGLTDGGTAHLLQCPECGGFVRWRVSGALPYSREYARNYAGDVDEAGGGARGSVSHGGPDTSDESRMAPELTREES